MNDRKPPEIAPVPAENPGWGKLGCCCVLCGAPTPRAGKA